MSRQFFNMKQSTPSQSAGSLGKRNDEQTMLLRGDVKPSLSLLAYRSYLDGLRAVSIFGVLVFHFTPPWLPGGFIGVDVFFVISGFLITKVILTDIKRSKFLLTDFWLNRIRRILPAYLFAIFITSLVGIWLMPPSSLVSLQRSVIASLAFAANIYFFKTLNYFTATISDVPLIHLWSLGVETQFYLLLPLLILAICRLRRSVWAGLCLVALISIGLSIWSMHSNPTAAFYLLPQRAYELLMGSMIGAAVVPTVNRRTASCIVLAGLSTVIIGMVAMSDVLAFPGLWALIPCLGAGLIIWGAEACPDVVLFGLDSRPMRMVGRVSYSLYLVHWPVGVFLGLLIPHWKPLPFLLAAGALSFLAAGLLYRYVEQRFRYAPPAAHVKRQGAQAAGMIALILVTALGVITLNGLPWRYERTIARILEYKVYDYSAQFKDGICFLKPDQTAADLDLKTCLPDEMPQVVLWGDSSLAMYAYGLGVEARKRGYGLGQLTFSGCPPVIQMSVVARPNCMAFNDAALRLILDRKPAIVVLGAVWSVDPDDIRKLDATLDALRSANMRTIVIGPPVWLKRPGPTVLAERVQAGIKSTTADDELLPSITLDRDAVLIDHFGKTGSSKYASVYQTACRNQCAIASGNVPFQFDVFHLTKEGSLYYAAQLADKIFEQ